MNKERQYNLGAFLVAILLTLVLYVFNTFFCTGECYVYVEDRYLGSLFAGFLGLSASLLVLLFFSGEIFISWTKRIAWWFLLGTIYFVASTSPYTSGILSIDRRETTIYCMSILFIVTLGYALIMNRKLKGNS